MAWVRREYGKRQEPRTKSTQYPELFSSRFRPEYRANRAAWCWTREQLRQMYQEEGLSRLQAGKKTSKLYWKLPDMDKAQIVVDRRWREKTYPVPPGAIERYVCDEPGQPGELWRIINSMNLLGPRWRKGQRTVPLDGPELWREIQRISRKRTRKRADLAEYLELVLSRESY